MPNIRAYRSEVLEGFMKLVLTFLFLVFGSSSFAADYPAQTRFEKYIPFGFLGEWTGDAMGFNQCNMHEKIYAVLDEDFLEEGAYVFDASSHDRSWRRNSKNQGVSGRLAFEVLDSEGNLAEFYTPSGKLFSFKAIDDVFYIVETPEMFERRKLLKEDCIGKTFEGPFIAKVHFEVNSMKIRFFEVREVENSDLTGVRTELYDRGPMTLSRSLFR